MTDPKSTEARLAALEYENAKLKKINQVLMDRVERSMDMQGNAYALFQSSINLGQMVRHRTAALNDLTLRLEEALLRAEQANLAKTKFLAALSHDLLQPLNAARLFSAALQEMDLPPEPQTLTAKVQLALDGVDDLVHTLLDFAKLDGGALEARPQDIRLKDLMAGLATELEPQAAAKGLAFRLVPSQAVIHGDPALLTRLLRNLLVNAIRYTPAGKVVFGCRRRGESILLQVWDSGVGIPADQRQAIFKEFKRLPNNKSNEQGVGLGLAIVDRLARLMELPVGLSSEVGRGSCFSVQVPLVQGQPRLPDPAPPIFSNPMSGQSVLVVDDEPAILEAMEALLNRWGCRVTLAGSGQEALMKLRGMAAAPDLLILDYHLQGVETGLDVLETLKGATGKPMKAIMLTANRSTELQNTLREMNLPLLNKPVKPAHLRALIAAIA